MKKTKIDWCDCTINPVIGCPRGCIYCYARKINDRFKWIEDWGKPQFFQKRLIALYETKKTKSIFMNSMSDIAYWENDWTKFVFDVMKENPQHKYIFLTKNDSFKRPYFYPQFQNVFIGKTITSGTYYSGFNDKYFDFLSIEPILSEININGFGGVRQVIIGAETGNRKGKVVPQKEWINKIVEDCDKAKVRVFMKSSLKEIMGDDFRQDELIWEVNKNV
jgi:protein gp37